MSDKEHRQRSYSPKVKRDYGISPLWILPLVTLALASWLVIKTINDAGQRIQIYFSDAQGLEAGRTTVRYQGLEVGMVRDITLSPDLQSIYVDADIYPEATKLLRENTRFWLVKPTASISGISGLDALVSGNYIAIHPGDNTENDEIKTEFSALESRPSDLQADEGLNLTLRAEDLGSISIGSQIIYKKIPIGEVYSYALEPDAQHVQINAFIDYKYAHIITDKSRFWNVSGVGANVGFDGIDIQFESLSALIGGAIAVDSPDGGEPVEANSQFKLYPDLKTAGRGIPIEITLPDSSEISANGAPIVFRGLRIGEITNLNLDSNRDFIQASAAIEPSFADILNSGSKFVLEEAKVSFSGVENIGNLIKGNYLTVVPGTGEEIRHFTAIRKTDLLSQQSQSVTLKIIGDDAFALEIGSKMLYRGIPVGSVTAIDLVNDKVEITALINAKYRKLIRSNNRFYITGMVSVDTSNSSFNVDLPPLNRLITESISFMSEGSEKIRPHYHLYAGKPQAELAKYNQSGLKTLTLFSEQLPSVREGSPLLYRNIQVGKVAGYQLQRDGVTMSVQIEKRYSHLINKDTVFWDSSGIQVEASLSGVQVKASPLEAMIRGGIAFDSIAGVENKTGKYWRLYPDFNHARNFGKLITLTTSDSATVAKGTPIKFQGVNIGEVTKLSPDFNRHQIEIIARIQPEYEDAIARSNSYFWLVSPQVGLSGIKNLDSLVTNYISVKPGKGKQSYTFPLHSQAYKPKGIKYILQSEQRNSIEPGTPVRYRDIEVGRVTDVELGAFSDRVVTTIEVEKQYSYLVRRNSIFWNSSGLNVSLGLSGAEVKAGTVDSLLRGGISFATPNTSTLQPPAQDSQSFYLYAEPESKWQEWRTAIPKPD